MARQLIVTSRGEQSSWIETRSPAVLRRPFKDSKIARRELVVPPLLEEHESQAIQDRDLLRRPRWRRSRRQQVFGRGAGQVVTNSREAIGANIEHLIEFGSRFGRRPSDAIRPDRLPRWIARRFRGDSPWVVAVPHTQNAAEPGVPGEQKMTKGLNERVLAVQPVMELRRGKSARPSDRRSPHLLLDQSEGVAQAFDVSRTELEALWMSAIELVADRFVEINPRSPVELGHGVTLRTAGYARPVLSWMTTRRRAGPTDCHDVLMRYFIDTKHTDDGQRFELISIAIVSEDGREYYAVVDGFDDSAVTPWIAERVLPQLPPAGDALWKQRTQIKEECRPVRSPVIRQRYFASSWDAFPLIRSMPGLGISDCV